MTSVMAPVNSVAKDLIALASKEVSGAMGTRVDRPRRFARASQTQRWWRFHPPWKEMKHSSEPSFRDRKSTRLNSSHTVISYAVFCLKKKNTQQIKARLHSCYRIRSTL